MASGKKDKALGIRITIVVSPMKILKVAKQLNRGRTAIWPLVLQEFTVDEISYKGCHHVIV